MAKRGPKPKPPELKLLRGVRSDRQNTSAPLAIDGDPIPPDHLDDVGLAKFAEVVAMLRENGVLSTSDSEVIALYASTFSLWKMARESINSVGDLTSCTEHGEKINPLVTITQNNAGLLARLQAEFGLTPSSRSRVSSTAPAAVDELESFITNTRKTK
jgi:P27 family predicted phage terminase small subunit